MLDNQKERTDGELSDSHSGERSVHIPVAPPPVVPPPIRPAEHDALSYPSFLTSEKGSESPDSSKKFILTEERNESGEEVAFVEESTDDDIESKPVSDDVKRDESHQMIETEAASEGGAAVVAPFTEVLSKVKEENMAASDGEAVKTVSDEAAIAAPVVPDFVANVENEEAESIANSTEAVEAAPEAVASAPVVPDFVANVENEEAESIANSTEAVEAAPEAVVLAPVVPDFVASEVADKENEETISFGEEMNLSNEELAFTNAFDKESLSDERQEDQVHKVKPPVAKDMEGLDLETVPSENGSDGGVKPGYASSPEKAEEAKDNQTDGVDYKSANFLKDLFANGNECVTVPGGIFSVKEDTRALLALFSNGRFFVSEAARFDGKVLGFEYLARKRRLQIGKPEYVPSIVINDIYEYASRNTTTAASEVESENQEQARMQRDFVTIVSRAAMNRVSDIHIVVADHTTVMFRVNGLMQTEMEYNKEWGESFVRAAFASSDISDSNYAQNEYQAAQKLGRTPLRGSNGRLVLPRNVLGIRLQFNPIAFGTRYVVMRLLYAEDSTESASSLSVLGFSKKEEELFYHMRAVPTGIIIVSGPTGSGKSTTLQRNMIAMLQERNYEINLITVEDPPEYPIPGARQMPVTNASIEEAKDREFTKALSAALRSDPDALMIGEVRTLSAADLAFRGALSGHNVWTTLHANSAPAVLMRLKDMGVEDFKLQDPDIMKGMLAQRLFRKVCPYCRIAAKDRLDHPAVQRLYKAFGDAGVEHSYLRGPGCKECDFRGVKGRTVVAEFVIPDATFLDLMIRGESKKALNYWINDLGGVTLRESALSRMLTGVIDIEEVERWTGFLDQQTIA